MAKKAERELKDIVVTNVDLVDRAANEEQFAVVKRKDRKEGRGMADKTKVTKGAETEEEKVAGEVAGAAETETDTEASTDDGGGDKAAVAKTAEAVTGLTTRLDSLLDHLEKKGKTSKQDEDEEDVTKADGIKMVKDALAAALAVKDLPADAKAKIESAIALLDKMKANGYGYPKPTEAKKSEDDGETEEVAKAGRILSKANLGKLQTAAKALTDATETITSMLKQAMGEDEDEESKSKAKKAKASKQEDEEDDEVEAKKAKGKKAEKAEDEEVKKSLTAISDSLAKISKRLDDAEAAVGITKSLGDGEDEGETEEVKKAAGGLWAGLGLVPKQ